MNDYLTHTKAAFDSASRTFDEDDNSNGILLWMRARAYEVYLKHFQSGDRLLELNSGTGIDAVYLASKGIKVHCTDISTGMLDHLSSKTETLGLSQMISYELKPFDNISQVSGSKFNGAISNFGGLNCIPYFTKLSADISSKLAPDGKFIAVVIGKYCPWEIFYYLLKFKPSIALRRLSSGGLNANLNGEKIRTFYFTPGIFAEYFNKEFTVEKIYSHGLYTPPPYLVNIYNKLKPFVKLLMKFDEITRGFFPFNRFGDHFIVVLKKKPDGN
ncbi:MAG: hypothetical protein IT281_03365 [Ignavibacteria bacterium]|nr:hypothetical protein [Ignavibacteria bacterium]MCC7158558.1 hypothetical protein [Ignavibacteria bacterium]